MGSLYAVIGLPRSSTDPDALPAAWRAFRCFEPYGEDAQEYARATLVRARLLRGEVVDLLADLRERAAEYRRRPGARYFDAEQNALVVKNAEAYYRAMVRGGAESWNVRDRHMAETLDRLMRHHGPDAKAIVWEHNTHIGDARYTTWRTTGWSTSASSVRRSTADGVVLVGFGSHEGTVIAGRSGARRWR